MIPFKYDDERSEWEQRMALLKQQREVVRRGEKLPNEPLWPFDAIPPDEIVP